MLDAYAMCGELFLVVAPVRVRCIDDDRINARCDCGGYELAVFPIEGCQRRIIGKLFEIWIIGIAIGIDCLTISRCDLRDEAVLGVG